MNARKTTTIEESDIDIAVLTEKVINIEKITNSINIKF
jgi:hypothetical protein